MLPLGHQPNYIPKHQEILLFESFKSVFLKEGNDDLNQVFQFSYSITHSISVIGPHDPTAKKAANALEYFHIANVLNDNEFRQHLHTECHLGMIGHSDMETAFTIREADDPLCIQIHEELKPERQVSEGFLPEQDLPCGLSPCPAEFLLPEIIPTSISGL
jgi:hypothetical protein